MATSDVSGSKPTGPTRQQESTPAATPAPSPLPTQKTAKIGALLSPEGTASKTYKTLDREKIASSGQENPALSPDMLTKATQGATRKHRLERAGGRKQIEKGQGVSIEDVTEGIGKTVTTRKIVATILRGDPKKIGKLAKVAFKEVKVKVKTAEFKKGKVTELTDKAALKKEEAEIVHLKSKLGSEVARDAFGDNFLVPARNIATKDVFSNESELKEAGVRKDMLLKLHTDAPDKFQAITGMDSKALAVDPNNMEPLQVVETEGVCLATCLHFAGRIMENFDGLSNNSLREMASEYKKGVPAEAAAMQSVYSLVGFRTQTTEMLVDLYFLTTGKNDVGGKRDRIIGLLTNIAAKAPEKLEQNFIEENPKIPEKDIRKMFGSTVDPFTSIEGAVLNKDGTFNNEKFEALLQMALPKEITLTATDKQSIREYFDFLTSKDTAPKSKSIREAVKGELVSNAMSRLYDKPCVVDSEGTHIANQLLGAWSDATSTAQQLTKFDGLEDGIYQPSFENTTNGVQGAHAILYIKKGGEGYFFDPNFGLIRCDPNKPHANTFMKLLNMYSPPPENEKHGKIGELNYHVTIAKYQPIEAAEKANVSEILRSARAAVTAPPQKATVAAAGKVATP